MVFESFMDSNPTVLLWLVCRFATTASTLHVATLRRLPTAVHHLAIEHHCAFTMSRNDDHTAIAMMTGDTIQRRLRSLDRLLLGVQNTIGNLMRSDFIDERLTDAGAGDRDGIVVGIGTTARQRRIARRVPASGW